MSVEPTTSTNRQVIILRSLRTSISAGHCLVRANRAATKPNGSSSLSRPPSTIRSDVPGYSERTPRCSDTSREALHLPAIEDEARRQSSKPERQQIDCPDLHPD